MTMNTSWLPVSLIPWCLLITIAVGVFGSYESDKKLLRDLTVLTLRSNEQSNHRRSYAVPQLSCSGGSAGCSFAPDVVQCYNRGTDGRDTQWECKADLDSDVRFGKIEVICEGYDHPDDPYILKGSCGLEYTLDYTKQGWKSKNGGQSSSNNSYKRGNQKSSISGGDIIMLGICGIIAYAIYTTCVGNNQQGETQPPPPGFRPEYTNQYPGQQSGHQSSSSYGQSNTGTNTGTGGVGGFWTGAGLGGLMGYMMGNRRGGNYYNTYPNTGYGTGWGNRGWGNGGFGGGMFGSGQSGYSRPTTSSFSSGGTRTASGFGGTRRR